MRKKMQRCVPCHLTVSIPLSVLLVSGVALCPLTAPASDNDETPPYMIYIDPETGKYTTTIPTASARTNADGSVVAAPPESDTTRDTATNARLWGIGTFAALIVMASGLWLARRRHTETER